MAELTVLGLNHRTAPVEVRESLALPGDLAVNLLRAMHADSILEEVLVLATCNRTELYALPRSGGDLVEYLLDHVARVKGGSAAKTTPAETIRAAFYRHDGLPAVRHLFRVAASLDSQIVGEHQILGQVKEAYRRAVEARTAGFLFNKLLHGSFRVGKRVQTETNLGRGSAGVATAAVELARQIFANLGGKTVLLVGAGRSAECAARALLRGGASRLLVANRTLSRARQLAFDLARTPASYDKMCEDDESTETPVTCPALPATEGAAAVPGASPPAAANLATEAIGLEDIPSVLPRVDLAITSTDSAEPILTHEALAPVLRHRSRPLFIVDIAVPRDVEDAVGRIENVFLYNIDDLGKLVEQNLARRRAEIPRAESIVEDELARFSSWLASRQVTPTIRLLIQRLETLEQAHLDRYGRQFSETDRRRLEQFTQSLRNQILHKPLEFLRQLPNDGKSSEAIEAVDLVRRLFDLDEPEPPE